MPKITNIKAYEILDSRGNPTVEAHVFLDDGTNACASVPSGASKGVHEAVELRDEDPKRYNGFGVLKSLEIIETVIGPHLKGMEVSAQKDIDETLINLDSTDNKGKLGANSILAVSLACSRVSARSKKVELYEYIAALYGFEIPQSFPVPMFNVINGGLHGGNNLSVQEFIVMPVTQKSILDRIRMGAEIYHSLKKLIKGNDLSIAVGDEGGFSPLLDTDSDALELLVGAISKSGYTYMTDVTIGVDMAASTYFVNGSYRLAGSPQPLSSSLYLSKVEKLRNTFNIFSLEDPLAEDEWDAWSDLTARMGNDTMIIGDDLLCTNKFRLKKAIEQKACNAILIKVNQIGTLSETLDVIAYARSAGFKVIISHRSGETTDDYIADLAVAVGADFVKFGAPGRGERVAKYNRLSSIYHKIHSSNGMKNIIQ